MSWPDSYFQNPETLTVRDECRMGLFGTAEPDQAMFDATNPLNFIQHDTMSPTFLWATAEDPKVPAANTLHMAERLMQASIPVETHIFETGEHGLALANHASAGTHKKIDTQAAQWVPLCEAWLSKRFSLVLTA